jgi:hypothetical protein
LPFQRGDVVLTPNGEHGMVTAVGLMCETPVYRVGKRAYWFRWQLKLRSRPKFIAEL